ncbi:MAG: NAD-dependent deacylase [Neomegalonema sp.]|nr:NAD-dependent deacylase [Neomegalonema sp.]
MSIQTPRIVILTGAGVSAESGMGTFRDKDGLWTKYDLEDVATPEGFARNPALVHAFYNERRRLLHQGEPNQAHFALAELEQRLPGEILIVTQNIDNLHEKAGSKNVLHMHGELLKSRCEKCGEERHCPDDLSTDRACPACGHIGGMRPAVVWFGEMPLHMEQIDDALAGAEQFVSIGTSGQVYPAAGYVQIARTIGLRTLELNLEATSSYFDAGRYGPATEIVPAWVKELIS